MGFRSEEAGKSEIKCKLKFKDARIPEDSESERASSERFVILQIRPIHHRMACVDVFMTSEHSQSDSPDDSTLFQGPAGWFTLKVPPSLDLEQNEAFVELKLANASDSKTADWSMTLYSAWVEEQKAESQIQAFDPSTLFPIVEHTSDGSPLNVRGTSQTWKGRSVQRDSGPWWNGLFQRKRVYHWQLWVVEYKSIILVASLQSKVRVPLSDSVVEQCEAVLNSIDFSDQLAKPPELFRDEVLELARTHYPLLKSKPSGGFAIKVADSEIQLANFYRSYLLDPESIQSIVLPGITAMVRLQEWGPDQLLPPLDEVEERIMPMLHPEEDAGSELKDLVRMPWVGGLSIMFVLDEADAYRFVHQAMLERWQLDVDDLMNLALENLADYSATNPLEVTMVGEDNEAQMLMPVKPNAYNSVRVLGEHLHGRLREILGPELVVGVPNRDFFVAVSLQDRSLIDQVQQRVAEDYRSMHHPLTSRLLVISADGVSEYCED